MSQVNLNYLNILNLNNPATTTSFAPPLRPGNNVNDILSDLFKSLSDLFGSVGNPAGGLFDNPPSCGCTSPPVIDEGSHPSGNLKTDGGKITTPGGYEIEPLGKFEWKITGPDGKSTRIWGDPHVAEGDGGKWDFKRDSTFMLPDGTRINVTTKPYGNNGMTVTGELEIINGNDRVLVTDIDKGKGNIGQVTADGFQHVNSFGGNDVFVMGNESDDWSFQGREIVGSNNGGESFKLGDQLAAGTNPGINPQSSLMDFLKELFGDWDPNWRPSDIGTNPYYDPIFGNGGNTSEPVENYNRGLHQQRLGDAFRALSDMFDALSRLANLNDRMYISRNSAIPV